MKFWNRKVKQIIWTETAISLYERQIAAREAMGDKWIGHPSNDVKKLVPVYAIPTLRIVAR